MTVLGTVITSSGREGKRVLLDSGSSHWFITPELAKQLQPLDGCCRVTLADGSRNPVAGRNSLQLDLHGPMTIEVLAVTLPDGILGQSWLKPNHGDLNFDGIFSFTHRYTTTLAVERTCG